MSRRAFARVRAQRDESGAAALEFALVVPILLIIVFAIISYGYMFSVRQALTQAAAEGARAAAVSTPSTQAATNATAAVNSALSSLSLTCGSGGLTCTPTTITCGSATCMKVTVSFAYRAHNPLPNLLPSAMIPTNLSFSSTAQVN